MEHYLTMKDGSIDELRYLLHLTAAVKRYPDRYRGALRDRNVALLFMKPSTRTRISFEVGLSQLGAHAVVLSASELQLGRGETIADTAQVLSRYLDAIMARVFEHSSLVEMAKHGSIPVINGLSDLSHPCQGLCDYFTIRERFGGELAGRKLAYIGDGNNVAHSLMIGGARLGVNVSVATPEGFEPKAHVLADARRYAEETGATIEVLREPAEAAENAHVLYADVWASMGQEGEREARLRAFAGYQIDESLLEGAAAEAVFMHCLPAHRGEEVSAAVIDSERSIVFDQAENRLHAQKALLLALLAAD